MVKNRTLFNETEFKAREEVIDGVERKVIEGYFIVYDSETELFPGYMEKVNRGAFGDLSGKDIRALWNHNHDLVLGRTGNSTVEFRNDEYGLWGKILVNEEDQDAVNGHARVKRGDVTGSSFGFFLEDEGGEYRDGVYHSEIRKADLFEVSPCVFPAYPQTEIKSRQAKLESIEKERLSLRKAQSRTKLLEVRNGENVTE